jgi:hypothetical protein
VFSIGTGAFRKTGLVEVCFENKNGWNCFRDLDGEISIPEESLYDYNNAAELLKDRLCDGYWFCEKNMQY